MATAHYLLFALEDQAYAVCIEAVVRVLRAVELTRVPDAPEILAGLINWHGSVAPVLDMRRRFNLSPRPLDPDDRIILCKTSDRLFGMIVDTVTGVVPLTAEDMHAPETILPDMEGPIDGVAVVDDRTLLIYDIGRLFRTTDIDPLGDRPAAGCYEDRTP